MEGSIQTTPPTTTINRTRFELCGARIGWAARQSCIVLFLTAGRCVRCFKSRAAFKSPSQAAVHRRCLSYPRAGRLGRHVSRCTRLLRPVLA